MSKCDYQPTWGKDYNDRGVRVLIEDRLDCMCDLDRMNLAEQAERVRVVSGLGRDGAYELLYRLGQMLNIKLPKRKCECGTVYWPCHERDMLCHKCRSESPAPDPVRGRPDRRASLRRDGLEGWE